MKPISYKRHRFPPETIRLAVWLYFRFTTSLRDVEEMLAERGIGVTYETIRCWANKFGPAIAANSRRTQPRADSVWHLDEMVVKIGGRRMFMWRAVDSEGEVLDMLLQKRRNKKAALKLLRKLLKNQGFVPERFVTDGLASYPAALKVLKCQSRHRPGRLRGNNRVANYHLPVRRRERKMQRFKSRARRKGSSPPIPQSTTPSIPSVTWSPVKQCDTSELPPWRSGMPQPQHEFTGPGPSAPWKNYPDKSRFRTASPLS